MTELKPEDRALIERVLGRAWSDVEALGSGTAGNILRNAMSALLDAARAEASEQRVTGLIGVLTEIAFDPIPMSEVIAKARAALTTKSGQA